MGHAHEPAERRRREEELKRAREEAAHIPEPEDDEEAAARERLHETLKSALGDDDADEDETQAHPS